MAAKSFSTRYRIRPGQAVDLGAIDTNAQTGAEGKEEGLARIAELVPQLVERQQVLYAEGKRSLLVVLQAMDTGGKDGTIRHVFGPLNPQGVRVASFKAPTSEELAHDFLWRIHKETPAKGMIRIFNRSHYEDVLVVRVHKLAPRAVIEKRYEQINAFEKYLTGNGVTVLKFMLHISKDEQKARLQDRLDRAHKHWKFSSADVAEREHWNDYTKAFERALTKCSTRHAPWYVIPADRKWYRNLAISSIVLETLQKMKLEFPPAEPHLEDIVIK